MIKKNFLKLKGKSKYLISILFVIYIIVFYYLSTRENIILVKLSSEILFYIIAFILFSISFPYLRTYMLKLKRKEKEKVKKAPFLSFIAAIFFSYIAITNTFVAFSDWDAYKNKEFIQTSGEIQDFRTKFSKRSSQIAKIKINEKWYDLEGLNIRKAQLKQGDKVYISYLPKSKLVARISK